jgi:hypothetical protein
MMAVSRRQRRAWQPVCEGLETRELLNAAVPAHHKSAEIQILRKATPAPTSVLQPLQNATPQLFTTVPANGDTNPYGLAFVPKGFPSNSPLQPGDILVSNFNNKTMQGLGTTIVRITPQGTTSTFYQGPPGIGFTNALGVLKRGLIVAGYVPTTDGTPNTLQSGGLLILDQNGKVLANLQNPNLLNGPWSLTIDDRGSSASIFVANVLSGSITRFDLSFPQSGSPTFTVQRKVQIASGFPAHTDPAAIVLGPAGMVYNRQNGALYVASESNNRIYVIPHAEKATRTQQGKGTLLVQDILHMHGPLGLAQAPNGNLVVANADSTNVNPNLPSELVEYTTKGHFVAQKSIDMANGGAFAVAFGTFGGNRVLAAVDDNTPGLQVYTIT